MQLLKSQLNSFYNVLEANDFNLSDFDVQSNVISDYYSVLGSCIYYKPENFFFNCGEDGAVFYATYSPSSNKLVENIRSISWSEIESVFMKWVFALEKEISQVDKWQLLRQSIDGVNIRVMDSSEKFSYQEFQEVESRINLLKDRIRQIPLTTEQFKIIDDKLDKLTESAKSSNKTDWGNIFIGSVVGLIMNLAITPDNAKLLWQVIKEVFNNYILLN